jgi:tetratricopeptide (TPR) repeat protein
MSTAAPTNETANAAAEAEFARTIRELRDSRPLRHPQLKEARRALEANRPDIAEPLIRSFLQRHRDDVDALNLLAEVAMRREQKSEAEALLVRCVALAPGFDAARFAYANALQQMNKAPAALEHAEKLLAKEPRNPLYRDLEAVILSSMGDHARALARRREQARDYPGSAKVLVSYAQSLRTSGLQEECVAAYRQALAADPALGTAWWGLANLRTYRLTADDIAQLQAQLARRDVSAPDRVHMLFALGKAFADHERYAESFDAYARANAARRLGTRYDPDRTSAQLAKLRVLFTPEFFRTRAGGGAQTRAPIFVVGMQRAGSTLLEQILASHSAVEGAGEMPNMRFLARRLEETIGRATGTDYPDVLARIDPAEFRDLGEDYLESTLVRRKLGRPFFVDKEPYNFWHVGFIQLALPQARIIDIRRHPLGCCLSNFTTIFLHGLAHTFSLAGLGRFYADYVAMMAHYDRVLPGRVYRIFYENLVADPESEIRRLLAWLDLPFEETCLAFHSNARAVNSASSEQVRSPIFHEALDRWRDYEPWLGPLIAALGPVLTAYPEVPDFGFDGS